MASTFKDFRYLFCEICVSIDCATFTNILGTWGLVDLKVGLERMLCTSSSCFFGDKFVRAFAER